MRASSHLPAPDAAASVPEPAPRMTMTHWPDRHALDLLGIDVPIVQAPMAGIATADLASAVAGAGGLASLPCTLLSPDQVRTEIEAIRRTKRPVNVNFLCHAPRRWIAREAWHRRLTPYYAELGLGPPASPALTDIPTFGSAQCEQVEALRPDIVSFHFGLPEPRLVERVRATGAKILSSATTMAEAVWLEDHGCDVIIAQGLEAGGHRGMFLSDDVSTQVGTMALVPQVVDAVGLPVIAAGGIADARGIVAALALGASAVQIGTAYLLCPEARTPQVHRRALLERQHKTAVTNLFTGRPARTIVNRIMRDLGPMSDDAPAFPFAAAALAPLRAKTEPAGSADFVPMWCGQAAHLARALPAADLTRSLAETALEMLTEPRSIVRGAG